MLVATVQAFNQACGPTHQPGRSWLAQASLRRRVAFQAGVLVGGRLNHISSPSYYLGDACTDCQVHPFGGLYAELFQPNRIAAVYGELSLSSFRNQGAEHVGGTSGSPIYMYYSYQGLLSTARLGVRFFFPLRHEQQLLFGLSYEWNTVWHPTQTVTAGPAYLVRDEDLPFATPTLLPNLALGWRIRRLTLSLDGQVYRSKSDDDGISSLFLGKDFGVRFGTAYRLGRNPDAKRR